MDKKKMTNSERLDPILAHDGESKEIIEDKISETCVTNNSNDNHGITINTSQDYTSLSMQEGNNSFLKYSEDSQNLITKTRTRIDKDYIDIDAIEILISVNLVTGELDFDVVSEDAYDLLDRKEHAVLASTFNKTARSRSLTGAEINAERNESHRSLDTLRHEFTFTTAGPTLELFPDETCVVEIGHEFGGNGNLKSESTHDGNGEILDNINEKRIDGNNSETTCHQHNIIDRHHHSSSSRHWSTPRDSFGREKQNRVHYVHHDDWKRQNYDRRYGYRNNQGYNNRRGGYREYCGDRRDKHYKPRNVISFSESDLIYSSRMEHENKNCNTPAPHVNKQITILKRGCTLDENPEKTEDVDAKPKSQVDEMIDSEQRDITADGESIPYGIYSRNITSDRKYYSTKYQPKTDHAEDADVSGDTEDDVKSKKRKIKKAYKDDKHKQKKPKKKVPKTRMEIFQSQLRAGHLKSIFSRWKTDGLKRIKLVDELHNGTFALKYKAIYNNEMVVLAVYIDQDTTDINAIDMVHMRNSKFIDGIRDCIIGPYSSLWLLSRYYPNGDLQTLLSRDPERHVVGEVHAQFITAGLLFALDYLHQRGIVHGNIKPSKILISRNGYPVLTGYLIVDETVLEERRDVYTPAYAAPERFRGHRGTAIDIFSLGCVGYEIVTGRTPFDDGNLQALRSNILDMSYRPVFEPELFSYAGEMFIDSCLRKPLKYRFRIGNNREHFLFEEWFSTLDLYEVERQNAFSPILQAMKQIEKSAILDWCEKTVDFNWGRALDITCPYIEPVCKIDWHLAQDYFLDFV